MFSRNGKANYNASHKAEGSFNFTAKDLHKLLEALAQQKTNRKNLWQWSFMNPKEIIQPYYTPTDGRDETLVFESRFESGNLDLAVKVSDTEYNLLLQNDSLTNGNTLWFYFKVSNTRKGKTVKFNILNFVICLYHCSPSRDPCTIVE